MRKMSRAAQSWAREAEADMLRARVPTGSLSHLSGKRFAAPVSYLLADILEDLAVLRMSSQ